MLNEVGFSILSAPIAATDRRALSQAWYSALHLAKPSVQTHQLSRFLPCESADVACEPRRSAPSRRQPAAQLDAHYPARRSREMDCAAPHERRHARSALARRIEETFLHPARRWNRVMFTMAGTRARVHVSLQATAGGARLVAICPPHVRAAVARALDEARYALARRGMLVDARVIEVAHAG